MARDTSVALRSSLESIDWIGDANAANKTVCALCQRSFHFLRRRHICRVCQSGFCKQCLSKKPPSKSALSGTFAKCCLECAAQQSAPATPQEVEEESSEAIEERRRLEVLHTALDAISLRRNAFQHGLDALCQFAANAFKSEIVAVTFMEANVHVFQAAVGLRQLPCLPRSDALCDCVVDSKSLKVCLDLGAAPHFQTNPFVASRDVLFYAGAPILISGCAIGTVCLMAASPRTHWTTVESDLLRSLAYILATQLLHVPAPPLLSPRRCSVPRDCYQPSEVDVRSSAHRSFSRGSATYSPHSRSTSASFMLDPSDWVPNHVRSGCRVCQLKFRFPLRRKHHCRMAVYIRVCLECRTPRALLHSPAFSPKIRLVHGSPADTYPSWAKDDGLQPYAMQRTSILYDNNRKLEALASAFAELVYAPAPYLTPSSDAMGLWMTIGEKEARQTIERHLGELLWPRC
ncbi:hypothetical protein ACHHYP_14912 [Achlya hypogyna]|uniref:FYVE-type domain-containing protein n=1 Tax=Achlya hypogyna TaxID=1202772 RepID=A0A1V9YC27_ACHHY|nr:hypothetical protein ACHHYP_14912 [Achlya hypogyna]